MMQRRATFAFIIAVAGTFSITGCGHLDKGTIAVSCGRIWRDNETMRVTSEHLKNIEKTAASLDSRRMQAVRHRSAIDALRSTFSLAGAVGADEGNDSKSGITNDVTNPSLPTLERMFSFLTNNVADNVNEDPLHVLQREDTVQQIIAETKLIHLRDSASNQDGWSLYRLGIDISVLPSGRFARNHSAFVELTIMPTGKTDSTDSVRVYALWPQHYADRVLERSRIESTRRGAMALNLRNPYGKAKGSVESASSHVDEIAHVQRYPSVAGFISGPRTFGWEVFPKLTRRKRFRWFWIGSRLKDVLRLQPGLQSRCVLLAVNDKNLRLPKTIVAWDWNEFDDQRKKIDQLKDQLKDEPKDERKDERKRKARELENEERDLESRAKKLIGSYNYVLKEARTMLEEEDFWRNEFTNIVSTTNIVPTNIVSTNIVSNADIKETAWSIITKRLREWINNGRPNAENQKKLERVHYEFVNMKKKYLQHEAAKINLSATAKWRNVKSGRLHAPTREVTDSVTLILPLKVDRTLSGETPVLPDSGPASKTTTVTIMGQDFGADADVFVGPQRATNVTVLSGEYIVADFPPLDKAWYRNGTNRYHATVKVLTGGDSLMQEKAFTYFLDNAAGNPNSAPGATGSN